MFKVGGSTDKKQTRKIQGTIYFLCSVLFVVDSTIPSYETIISLQNVEVTVINIIPSDAPIFDFFPSKEYY